MALDALRSTFKRPATAAATAASTAVPGWGATPATPYDPEPSPVAADPSPAAADVSPVAPQPSFAAPVAPAPATPASAPTAYSPATYAADQYAPVFADPVAGGGTDAQAFTCPSCGRTLTRGMFRCDGCSARYLLDVPAKRAGALAAGGAAAGILVTLLLVNVFAPPRPASGALAAGDPLTGAGQGTAPGVLSPAAAGVPSGAVAALKGTTLINGRLASEATGLAKALAAKSFRTGDVVKILRRMAIDTRAGSGMLRPLSGWADAAGQQAALAAFYDDLASQIDSGLAASVNSAGSYRKAAKTVLATLGDVPKLDADARALATTVGLELPAVTIPGALR